jgi:hypothetical protein
VPAWIITRNLTQPQRWIPILITSRLWFITCTFFGGTNGEFCTCAITAFNSVYDQIYYVAFVDSATGNPEPGFEPWGSNSFASASWATYGPGLDWSAYVAEVTGGGLVAGKAVNLIVRATLPVGFTYNGVDSLLYSSALATDAYDSTNHVVANMHNSISGLGFNGDLQVVSEEYFTGISQTNSAPQSVSVFPNPASHMITFVCPASIKMQRLQVYNALGVLVRDVMVTTDILRLFRNDLPAGAYNYRVTSETGHVISGKLMFY